MQDLRLISIWSANRDISSHIKFHSHKYHELVYYPSGSGTTQLGGKAFAFSGHCFAVIAQNTEHNEVHQGDSEVICLGFSGAPGLKTGFYADHTHMIHNILNELMNEVRNQEYGYKDMLSLKLNELLLHILRNENNSAATKSFDYIINYIRGNFHEQINLTDCARQLSISYDYFQHKFKALTGLSPQHFLMEQRFSASKKMLAESNYNCTQIAYRCGFCTCAQFSALFKKRFGMTPLQFRKQQI